MKKIYTLAIAIIFAGSAFAQHPSAPELKPAVKVSMDASMLTNQKIATDTLGWWLEYRLQGPFVYVPISEGYALGTGYSSGLPYTDGAFVGIINNDLGKYVVEEVLVWFGPMDYGTSGGTSNVTARISLLDAVQTTSSYTGPVPGTSLGSGSVTINSIDTVPVGSGGAGGFKIIPLASPAVILSNAGDWAVELDLSDCTTKGDTLSIIASKTNPSATYTAVGSYSFQRILGMGPTYKYELLDIFNSGWGSRIPAILPVYDINFIGIPEDYNNGVKLYQNYPNPSDGNTVVSYEVETPTNVVFSVINTQGQQVYSENGLRNNGTTYSVDFKEKGLASGIYYYSLFANGQSMTMKMVISE